MSKKEWTSQDVGKAVAGAAVGLLVGWVAPIIVPAVAAFGGWESAKEKSKRISEGFNPTDPKDGFLTGFAVGSVISAPFLTLGAAAVSFFVSKGVTEKLAERRSSTPSHRPPSFR